MGPCLIEMIMYNSFILFIYQIDMYGEEEIHG